MSNKNASLLRKPSHNEEKLSEHVQQYLHKDAFAFASGKMNKASEKKNKASEKMNNPLKIPARESNEKARDLILNWLGQLPKRVFKRVFYEWKLFHRKPGVTFQFLHGKKTIFGVHRTITVSHPRIVNDLVPPDFQINDQLNLRGYGVQDAIGNLIPKIGFDERDTTTISHLIMSKWAELPDVPATSPDVPAVQFEFDADVNQIVVTGRGRTTIYISINEPEN